jgi:hypothetical protein
VTDARAALTCAHYQEVTTAGVDDGATMVPLELLLIR